MDTVHSGTSRRSVGLFKSAKDTDTDTDTELRASAVAAAAAVA